MEVSRWKNLTEDLKSRVSLDKLKEEKKRWMSLERVDT